MLLTVGDIQAVHPHTLKSAGLTHHLKITHNGTVLIHCLHIKKKKKRLTIDSDRRTVDIAGRYCAQRSGDAWM
jgi:hypothetical protein